MRLFIGIPLPTAVTDELSALSVRLRSRDDGLRWSVPETWHITLQFLGNTTEDCYDCIVSQLGNVGHQPIPVELEDLGFFDRAGVFFAGVSLMPGLISLQRHVIAATALCGFVPETRPYHPHITLARTKGKAGAQSLRSLKARLHRQPTFTRFTANEFLLYESQLSPSGSRYVVRERFPLANSNS
jgi:RNA 2',3'-cyclic 3'-phosphodiesterase